MTKLTVIGTGLIGTSIGLRLRRDSENSDLRIVGVDHSRDHAREAQRRGAFHEVEPRIERAVRDASVVVIATPIIEIREVMETMAPSLEDGAIVTDVASSKAEVLRWAEQALPHSVHFVGGHPMAGRTEFGPRAAEAELFEGARWAIVASQSAAGAAVETVSGLAQRLGAKPMFMDAEEHDAYVAGVSHLPLVAATALFRLMRASEAWPELSLLAASGFKDTTRLAATDEGLSTDIAITNREQLVQWLQRYRRELYELEQLIEDPESEEDLYKLFTQASMDYVAYVNGAVGRTEVDQKGDFTVPGVGELMLGAGAAERLRVMTRRAEERAEEAARERGLRRRR